jgi:hypothetical protein
LHAQCLGKKTEIDPNRRRAEDVGEALEPALEPLLARSLFRVGGRLMIRLGDADVDYDQNFRSAGARFTPLQLHNLRLV